MFRLERGKKGFTLIELLVVIAIIAILAAILFPVFARARRAAQKTACISNLKQMGIGINMYMSDWDNKLPYCVFQTQLVNTADGSISTDAFSGATLPNASAYPAPFDGSINAADKHAPIWDIRDPLHGIKGYIRNDKIFTCPASSGSPWAKADGSGNVKDAKGNQITSIDCSYMYNEFCVGKTSFIAGMNAERCQDPSTAPILWDTISGFGTQAHDDNINVEYMDFHAKSVQVGPANDPRGPTFWHQQDQAAWQ